MHQCSWNQSKASRLSGISYFGVKRYSSYVD
ncbi:MAG: hypothetical protein GY777_29855 [Candidatus Brocadiaceae bacterium]|nr:hypothetical protein [Candidatus Brocadiaceae bacterium]